MSNVNGPTGSGGVMNGITMGVESITPDALFSYCASRINGIDTQVKEAFAQQQRNNDIQGALGDVIGSLNQAVTGGTDGTNNLVQATIGWYWNAINKAGGPSTPEGSKLMGMMKGLCDKVDPSHKLANTVSDPSSKDFQDMMAGHYSQDSAFVAQLGGRWSSVTHDTIDAAVKDLTAMNDEVGKGGELMMIKLQSLMSQRQLAIQITTNLIQTIHDSSKQIAGNLHA